MIVVIAHKDWTKIKELGWPEKNFRYSFAPLDMIWCNCCGEGKRNALINKTGAQTIIVFNSLYSSANGIFAKKG